MGSGARDDPLAGSPAGAEADAGGRVGGSVGGGVDGGVGGGVGVGGEVGGEVGGGGEVVGAFGSARNLDRDTLLAAQLETAASLWAKFMGLMGRPSLAPGHGLWLPASNGIHMMFMRFAIDAVFVTRPDAQGARRVRSVHRGLRAWTGLVPLVRGADGVLELPVGTIDATGTVVGDRLEIVEAG
ncbi:MAG: DUF192 domain-containing protein [Chloroflexota bacterium]